MGAIVISGSEDQLTEEEEWIQQHCPWTDSDAEHFPADDGSADDPSEIWWVSLVCLHLEP